MDLLINIAKVFGVIWATIGTLYFTGYVLGLIDPNDKTD